MRRLFLLGNGLFSSFLLSCLILAGSLGKGPAAPDQWEFVGPKNIAPPFRFGFGEATVAGRVSSAAFDPVDANKIYIAAPGGGVFRSTDAGVTWQPLSDGWPMLATSCIVVDPNNPDTLYVGTGDYDGDSMDGIGIMKSTDGGETWLNLGQGQSGGADVRRILIDPDNSQIVTIVAGRGQAGVGQVYRSTNGGSSWTAVINFNASWSDIVCSAKTGSIRSYYAVASGSNSQVWKSTDRGATWTMLNAPLRSGVDQRDTADLACSPTNPSVVYLIGTGDQKIWKSSNGGSSWQDITGTGFDPVEWQSGEGSFSISCGTTNGLDLVYVGLGDLRLSVAGTSTWRTVGATYTGGDILHANQHDYIPNPSNGLVGLACNDGGVYRTTLNPVNLESTAVGLNDNLPITQVNSFAIHPFDETKILAGTISNGSIWCNGDLDVWRGVLGSSGTNVAINPSDPDVQYSTYPYLGGTHDGGVIGLNRTFNAWSSNQYSSISAGTDVIDADAPMALDPSDPATVYLATNYLYRFSEMPSPNWTTHIGGQKLSAHGAVTALAVAKSDHRIIYTGSDSGEVFVSRDSGESWQRIDQSFSSLPTERVSSFRISDSNPNDVLVTFASASGARVWRCDDTSSPTRAWISVSGLSASALPNVPVFCIERDPLHPDSTWYAGTAIGVFKTEDRGQAWANITGTLRLPPVAVRKFQLHDGFLYAATNGRGIWRMRINSNVLGIVGVAIAPSVVVGPAKATVAVTLSIPAPSPGATIALSSDHPEAVDLPSSITIPQGSTVGTASILAHAVDTPTIVTISATINGSTQAGTLTINPSGLYELSFAPSSVRGGNTSQATLRTGSPAPDGGLVVTLTNPRPDLVQLPPTVTIPEGDNATTFTVLTMPTSRDTPLTITAESAFGNANGTLTVTSPRIATWTISPTQIVGGQSATGTIALDSDPPASGLSVTLSSSNNAALMVPQTTIIPGGSRIATVPLTSHAVQVDTTVTVTASASGESKNAAIQIKAQRMESLTFTPNPVIGGSISVGKITLLGPAISPTTVTLLTLNGAVANVPSSVTIPAGQTSATFNATTSVATMDTVATIRAILGTQNIDTTLVVQPLRLSGFTLAPSAATEGQTVTGTVTINGPAPSGGISVSITNSNSATAAFPTSVLIPQGQTSKSFTVVAKAVTTTQNATIKATRGTTSITQAFSVSPVAIASLAINGSMVPGGTLVPAVVTLAGPAPSGGARVNLASSNTGIATVPSSVTIPAGSRTASFTVTTKPVANLSSVIITASRGSSSKTATLTVTPPEVTLFTISPTSTRGGSRVTGTVKISGKAPAGGLLITITSSPSLVAPVTTVRVPQNATQYSFQLQTSTVSAQTVVTVSARSGSVVKSAQVTLRP